SVQSDVQAAQAALAAARASLAELQTGPSASDLERARLKVDQAKTGLWAAQASRDTVKGSKGASDAQRDAAEATVLNAQVAVQLAELELRQLGEPPDAAALQAAQARVASARAQLDKLQATDTTSDLASAAAAVAKAKAEIERLQGLPRPEEIAVAQAQAEQARVALTQARRLLDQTTLRAPADGTILALAARVGQQVTTASPVGVLADLAHPRIEAQVHELHIGQIGVGQAVRISFDAYPGRTFEGTVIEIAPTATLMGSTVSYAVRIGMASQPVGAPASIAIRPGMLARADVALQTVPDALWVPRGALHVSGGEWFVRVWRGGRATDQPVHLGLRDGRRVQVLDGVQEGDQVLLNTVPLGAASALPLTASSSR
ncbi:MAG: efflux RND transporter periplasmic adaptor subunit, partial [Chloroflexota bacterium]